MADLLCVSLGSLCFGLVLDNGIVVKAAPVAKYTVGWTAEKAWRYFVNRGGEVTVV